MRSFITGINWFRTYETVGGNLRPHPGYLMSKRPRLVRVNKSKSGIKNSSEIILKILINITSDCNDENNFPHILLLTNIQVSRLHKVNNSSANIKVPKTQLHKTRPSGGLLGRLPEPLLK